MSFKVKHMIFGKIAIILIFCLLVNIGSGINNSIIVSYADDAVVSQNPLFIPITTLVTAVAVGSGIIAKNSSEAISGANQLLQNAISNIKTSEVEKSEADSNYDSPYRVINGGQPEKPNNSNKNGKWVALGAGSLASNEIWANKEAIINAMQEINKLNGYKSIVGDVGLISADGFKAQSTASAVSLKLAQISNSAVTQFDNFLHSSFFDDKDFGWDDCYYVVNVKVTDILKAEPLYPGLVITVLPKSDQLGVLGVSDLLQYRTYSNSYGSMSYYYVNSSNKVGFKMYDSQGVSIRLDSYYARVDSRTAEQAFTFNSSYLKSNSSEANNLYIGPTTYGGGIGPSNQMAYEGYLWEHAQPWTFTNNIYNVNMTFDENFTNWLQEQVQIIGQNLMDAVRLGFTSIEPSWEPTQEQIQQGVSPASVIYQFINNYENPENIPEEEQEPDSPVVVPPAIEEPQPTNDYLNNFLLPESITTKFPFCIPFDIARALRLFSVSQREAPKWECDLNYGSSTYHVVIDLAIFNDVASFIRPLEFIVFLVGLALGTRSLIRG